ncbi:DJ-1/PfpI family protein [Undibacterium amnicola]|uniref:DJ-1/PfpI family protein n=2 Tax=Undibacterium amnicola TaxID=1834038 RepID=A0ABR6XVH7_9BURK|nr:DJ-1/PfpI family protein [Undibacterium amnicola]
MPKHTSGIPTFQARDGRTRPTIAVIAENRFTELTDYVIPYSILKHADIAEVYALGMQEGIIQMFPTLRLRAQFSAAQFDNLHPAGADYVIVPAVHYSEDPELISWIQSQAKKGATIIGICDGVWVLANAGLLENKRAVGHWYSFDDLAKQFPRTQFIKNKRYLADGNIVTSTGISASIPVSLALVDAIAGEVKTKALANELGIPKWDDEHRSADFTLSAKHIWTASINWLRFWGKDRFMVPISNGVDELSLALLADAYSRTYRSTVFSFAKDSITSLRGLQIVPEHSEPATNSPLLFLPPNLAPGHSLDWILQQIALRYDERSASFVALQMEYPYRPAKE